VSECNHIVGQIRAVNKTMDEWLDALCDLSDRIVEFNTSRKALPYPGHVERFKFCPSCGIKNLTPPIQV